MNNLCAAPGGAQNYFAALGADYIARGYPIIPIYPGDKRPMDSGWTTLRIDREDHARRAAGDAARAGVGILAGVASMGDSSTAVYLADVDSRNEQVAQGVREWLDRHVGLAPERVGEAPKFGAAFRAAPGARKIESLKFYDPGRVGEKDHAHKLEWLGTGQQFVAHGVHPVTRKPYKHDGIFGTLMDLAPSELPSVTDEQKLGAIAEFERLCRAAGLVQASGTSLNARIEPRPEEVQDLCGDLDWLTKPNITIAQVKEALDVLADQVDDYDFWIKVGMACHYQGHGALDEGDWLDLWDGWSATGLSYNARSEIEAKWKSFAAFKGNAKPTTVATILAMAKDARAHMKYSAVGQYKRLIEAAETEQDLRDGVCTRISRDASIEAIDREVLVERVQIKLKDFTGNKPPVALVRELLRPAITVRQQQAADWASPWVWVTEEDSFFNTKTKERYSKKSFDAVYNRFFDGTTEGGKPIKVRASDVVLDKWDLPIVSGVRYLPAAEALFTMNGRSYANSYRTDLIPAVPIVYSDEDNKAIAAVERHLELLVPVDAHRTILLQALAWIVTHPGRKMQWAPLIKGVQGDGKTVLTRLLANVMGHENVNILSADTLSQSTFTGWVENNCVIVFEELMLHGRNRHEIVNKLKPIITNERIEVHPKGRDPYTAPNTSNVIAMTNHEDAIPLSDDDRRWFVLFSPWEKINDFWAAVERKCGLDIDQYWRELWNAVNNHVGALRGWLESIDLSTFDPYARAPETEFKAAMIAEGISDMDLAVKDILDKGEFGSGKDGIALGAYVAKAVESEIGEKPQSKRFKRAMENAGFRGHPKRTIKYEGKSYRLYVSGPWAGATIEEVSAHLRAIRCDEWGF